MEDEQRERLLAAAIVALAVAAAVGFLLWSVLVNYIEPATATERKDVVNMLVLSVVGIVGFFTALAAFGNLSVSRRNLEQQRELDDRRAQDDALQDYFGKMGELLTTHKLMDTERENDPLRLLARAHTQTVLRIVSGSRRKTDVARFLESAGLVNKNNVVVKLSRFELQEADLSGANLGAVDFEGALLNNADFSRADLSGANLEGADLTGAFLSDADLSGANLEGADLTGAFLARTNLRGAFLARTNLSGALLSDAKLDGADFSRADLSGADLIDADLSGADLSNAILTGVFLSGATVQDRQLEQAESLTGATMPDGTQHP